MPDSPPMLPKPDKGPFSTALGCAVVLLCTAVVLLRLCCCVLLCTAVVLLCFAVVLLCSAVVLLYCTRACWAPSCSAWPHPLRLYVGCKHFKMRALGLTRNAWMGLCTWRAAFPKYPCCWRRSLFIGYQLGWNASFIKTPQGSEYFCKLAFWCVQWRHYNNLPHYQ